MTEVKKQPDRRIKFLSRDLPFPTDPSFREYRMIQDLTGVTAQDIMTGAAGIWMLPVLAIVALMRSDRNATRETLGKIMELGPADIELAGLDLEEDEEDNPPVEAAPGGRRKSTGTRSTTEKSEESGTQD